MFKLLALLLTSESTAFRFLKLEDGRIRVQISYTQTSKLMRTTRHRVKGYITGLESVGALTEVTSTRDSSQAILRPSRALLSEFLKR